MVPTNRTHVWFGWVAQGWNITFLRSPNQPGWGQCPGHGGWVVG